MKKMLKGKLSAGIMAIVLVCLAVALAGDVIVKEGEVQADKAKIGDLEISEFDSGMQILQTSSNDDLYIRVNDGGTTRTALYFDSSAYGKADRNNYEEKPFTFLQRGISQ